MTAANPKAPFRVDEPHSQTHRVIDADSFVMAHFYGPDRQARAEAMAAEYEQTYGPEWSIDGKSYLIVNRNTGECFEITRIDGGDGDAFRAHICRLLNEHGGPQ